VGGERPRFSLPQQNKPLACKGCLFAVQNSSSASASAGPRPGEGAAGREKSKAILPLQENFVFSSIRKPGSAHSEVLHQA